MQLTPLCSMDLAYTSDFHLARPYGNECGLGWGIGKGTVTGERLSGDILWSNQPRRRGDGIMLPNVRGVITTVDAAEVFVDLAGRTVFVERDGATVGRQLLMTLFETEAPQYAWLNNTVCMTEGMLNPTAGTAHFEVHICGNDLT
jgi:hypothetical protein